MALFVISCTTNQFSQYTESSNPDDYHLLEFDAIIPDKSWVGKYIFVKYTNRGGWAVKGKEKIYQILKYRINENGYPYFEVQDLDSTEKLKIHSLYLFWFLNYYNINATGPCIYDWREAIPKDYLRVSK